MRPWKWQIDVERVVLDEERGIPRVLSRGFIGRITVETGHHLQQELEVVYSLLVTKRFKTAAGEISIGEEAPLWRLVKKFPDGHFRLLFWKQLVSDWLSGKGQHFGFYGYAVVRKRKDCLFFDTKYFQLGNLNAYNLLPWDPVEMVRCGHDASNPLVQDMPWGDRIVGLR